MAVRMPTEPEDVDGAQRRGRIRREVKLPSLGQDTIGGKGFSIGFVLINRKGT
jgi:hypothetical protein